MNETQIVDEIRKIRKFSQTYDFVQFDDVVLRNVDWLYLNIFLSNEPLVELVGATKDAHISMFQDLIRFLLSSKFVTMVPLEDGRVIFSATENLKKQSAWMFEPSKRKGRQKYQETLLLMALDWLEKHSLKPE